jgi:tetratricopeptide (TPR) repeat protein
MRRIALIAVVLALAAGAAFWLRAATRRSWTTDSPAALAEYERGRQVHMRFYFADARAAYERALELDPGFVAAKLALIDSDVDQETRVRLVAELRAADRERLTERERFLLDILFARLDDDLAGRTARIEAYLERHPEDPWALYSAASDSWIRQDWEVAERRYRRLLEVDPNWVLAHNNLGYIAMAQGRFAEAEARFRTYRFVAPDQANPHDSLGELLVLIGRYDEARAELEEALAIRPDFCASYDNLMRLAALSRRPGDLDALAPRVARDCHPDFARRFACMLPVVRGFLTGDAEAPWRAPDPACEEVYRHPEVLVHRLALVSGRRELALALEETLRAKSASVGADFPKAAEELATLIAFFEGQRASIDGDWARAIERWRAVDAAGEFWQAGGGGVLKLIARRELARALREVGDEAAAAEAIARTRAVNPAFADQPWEGWPLASSPPGDAVAAAPPARGAAGSI